MLDEKDLHIAVDHAVNNLRRAVRNVRKFSAGRTPNFPPSLIDHPVVHLRDDLLGNARVFANRESMLSRMAFPQGGVCAEIGTSTGVFAKRIIEALKPRELHIFDIDFSRFDQAIRKHPGVAIHEGDSVRNLEKLPDDFFDFVYVDADHSYKSVKAEIAVLKRKVRNGGYLMFNDYTRWSISEVLSYGVMSAVNEFLVEDNIPLLGIALSGTGHFDVATQIRK